MTLKRGCLLGCLGVLAIPFLLVVFASGAWLSPFPTQQVAFEHNIWLPNSTKVVSRENSGIWLPDAHAHAVVSIAEKDAHEFVKRLKQHPEPKLTGNWSVPTGGEFCGYKGYSFAVRLEPARQGRIQVEIRTTTD
jgi:hypothetical protein